MPGAKIKNLHIKNSRLRHKPRGISRRAFERVYWPYLPLLIIAVALFIPFGQRGQLSLPKYHSGVLAYSTSMSINGLLLATNSERLANGAGSLGLNNKLVSAAQAKANDMVARNYWSHNTPDGSPPWIFVDSQGYAYQKLGENLAAGFSNENTAIAGWMASPTHRENMLSKGYSEVGFGFSNSPSYVAGSGQPMTVVVAFYGTPKSVAAATTAQPAATKPPAKKIAVAPNTPAPVPASVNSNKTTSNEPVNPDSLTENKKTPASSAQATDAARVSSSDFRKSTSNLQLLLRGTPFASAATASGLVVMFATGSLWISRHVLSLRRMLVKSEAFVIHHPMLDFSLVGLAALAYVMTRTVGFIQ